MTVCGVKIRVGRTYQYVITDATGRVVDTGMWATRAQRGATPSAFASTIMRLVTDPSLTATVTEIT